MEQVCSAMNLLSLEWQESQRETTRRQHRRATISYHQHNEAARVVEVLPLLESGARVALVSDAGLPGLNDPGGRLIAAALERGIPLTVLPGPSAIETALVASGLAGEQYRFVGYLPRREGERAKLWAELASWPYRRGVRVAEASGQLAGEPCPHVPGSTGGRLSRADEAPRGSRARNCAGRCGALRRTSSGGGCRRPRWVSGLPAGGRRRRRRGSRARLSRRAAATGLSRRRATDGRVVERSLRRLSVDKIDN